jgi:hypothetical protein
VHGASRNQCSSSCFCCCCFRCLFHHHGLRMHSCCLLHPPPAPAAANTHIHCYQAATPYALQLLLPPACMACTCGFSAACTPRVHQLFLPQTSPAATRAATPNTKQLPAAEAQPPARLWSCGFLVQLQLLRVLTASATATEPKPPTQSLYPHAPARLMHLTQLHPMLLPLSNSPLLHCCNIT